MSPYPGVDIALPVLAGAVLMGIAALVAKTGWAHLHNRLYATLYLLSGIKSVSDGVLSRSGSGAMWADLFHASSPLFPDAGAWRLIQGTCAFFMAPLLLHFVLVFPRVWRRLAMHAWLPWLLYVPSVGFAAAYLLRTPRFVDGQLQNGWVLSLLYLFEILATIVTVIAIVRVTRALGRTEDSIERKQASYLLIGFIPSFLVGWLIVADDLSSAWAGAIAFGWLHDLVAGTLVTIMSPILETIAAGLVGYAILKYRLMGAELQVKGGMKYVVMSVMVGTVLFLLNTYVGNFVLQAKVFAFAGPTGSAVLGGIFTILVFKPVEKLSAKVTDRMFPETTKDPAAYARKRAVEIYHAQATYVLQDASVTDKEMAFLRTLREQLGLTEQQALTIEESVERNLGVDDARTGQGEQPAP